MSGDEPLFRRILLPLDFTPAMDASVHAGLLVRVGDAEIAIGPASVRALELATKLAQGGTLRLLHVTPALEHHSVYGTAAGIGSIAPAIAEIHRSARESSIDVLRQIAAHYCPGIACEYEARPGRPLTVILDEVERFHPELLVLPASGHGRVLRFVLGSTADRIIREAQCPVVVVPNRHDEQASP